MLFHDGSLFIHFLNVIAEFNVLLLILNGKHLFLDVHKIAKKGYNFEQVHNLSELKGKRNVKVEDYHY